MQVRGRSYGRSKVVTSPGEVDLRKKPKDLSTSESEECGHGKGGGVYTTLIRSDTP